MRTSSGQTSSTASLDEEQLATGFSPSHRRRHGVYFTPAALVSEVLERAAALAPAHRPLTIIDPACGAGAFLHAAAHRFPSARLFGLELSAQSARRCRHRVPAAKVHQGDALRGGWERLEQALPPDGFELWVGNPPYNGTSAILEDPARRAELQGLLPGALPRGTSLRDDFAFFVLLAARRLTRREGAFAFITPSSLLDAFLYAPLRAELLRILRLEQVLELGGGVFAQTQVRTCVTFWSTRRAALRTTTYAGRSPEGAAFDASALQRPVPLSPSPPEWLLRPASTEAQRLDDTWRAHGEPLSTLVPISFPGLKTRFDELLVDDDPDRLFARVDAFLRASPKGLARFAQRYALPARVAPKLAALRTYAGSGVRASRDRLRPFWRYAGARHRGTLPADARAWCYLDRRLIPRGDHRLRGDYDPHACDRKLVFNARELPLAAASGELEGCIHMHRHARFAPLLVPARVRDEGLEAARPGADLGPPVPNLSPAGLAWAERVGGPERAFARIAAFINSDAVQQTWAPAFGAARELYVPLTDQT